MAPQFGRPVAEPFAERFADDIVLEAAALAKPVEDNQNVATVLTAASSIYESLEFTAIAKRVDNVSALACNAFRRHADRLHHNSRASVR